MNSSSEDSDSSSSSQGNNSSASEQEDDGTGTRSSTEEEAASSGKTGVGGHEGSREEQQAARADALEEEERRRKEGSDSEPTARPFRPFNDIQSPSAKSYRESDQDVVSNVDVILQALRGKLFGGVAEMRERDGGSPRRWAKSRGLTEINDSDCVETAMWFDRPTPCLPRKMWRGDNSGGGRVAIIRDTSRSMHGAWAAWASTLTSKIIDMGNVFLFACLFVLVVGKKFMFIDSHHHSPLLFPHPYTHHSFTLPGRKKKMQIGYLEFNHDITAPQGTHFFSNRYAELARLAKRLDCQGVTNYQLPIEYVLRRFEAEGPASRRQTLSRGGSGGVGESLLNQRKKRRPKIKHDIYGGTDYNHSHYTSWSTLEERVPTGTRNNHIIFLTDGVPTSGSRDLSIELAASNRLGVSIHTVFMGRNDFPQILHKMSLETGGARFSAWKQASTRAIEITRHRGSATIPTDMSNAPYGRNVSVSYGGAASTGGGNGRSGSNIFGWYSRQCN